MPRHAWAMATPSPDKYNPEEFRQLDAPLWYPGTDALGARSGLRPGHVPASLSGYDLTVNACSGVIAASGAPWTTVSGPYRWALTGGDVLTLAPATTQERKDVLVARILDADVNGSTTEREAVPVLITGTPGAGTPALEASDVEIGTATVYANGSPAPSFALAEKWTVTLGGILPVPTRTDLPTVGVYDGMAAYIEDEQAVVIAQGGTWTAIGSRRGFSLSETLIYTSNSTWTKANYPGVRALRVKCQGGGGGGGGAVSTASTTNASSGSGGRGGNYAESWILASSLGTTASIVVGAGGNGGTGVDGSAGGTSSFGGSIVSAGGGAGGIAAGASSGWGGADAPTSAGAATGDIIAYGGCGSGSMHAGSIDMAWSGSGGDSHMGGGGRGRRSSTSLGGGAGAQRGGGGGGGANGNGESAASGGDGAPGIVIVEVWV